MPEPKNSKRCPHYQLYSEPLGEDGPPAFLAVRRCLLTERLIKIIRPSEGGDLLAQKLQVQTSSHQLFAVIGPDLDAVTQRACTVARCEDSCTPSYKQHLDNFRVADPFEEAVTCEEEEETPKGNARNVYSDRDAIDPVSYSK